MTQIDIEIGRVITVVGVASPKPAEFVFVHIGQNPGGAFGAGGWRQMNRAGYGASRDRGSV